MSANESSQKKSVREGIEEKLRLKKEEEEKNITFKPKIFTNSRVSNGEDQSTSTIDRFSRLYNDATKRQVKHSITSGDLYNNQSSKPFMTNTTRSVSASSRDKLNTSTISEESINRLYSAHGAGRSRSRNNEVKVESNFQPKIYTKRSSSAERQSHQNYGDRLYNSYQKIQEKHSQLKEKTIKKVSAECTFTPKVNNEFNKNIKKSEAPVVERLLHYDELRNERLARKTKEKETIEASQTPFKPTIVTPFDKIGSRVLTTETDVFTRLTKYTAPTMNSSNQIIEEVRPKPNIPVASVQMVQRKDDNIPVHERLHLEAEKRRLDLEKLKLSAQKLEENETLTFHPKVSVDIVDNSTENVFTRLTASRQYVQNILSQVKSDQELSECTFKPQLPDTSNCPIPLNLEKKSVPIHERLFGEHTKFAERRNSLQNELHECTFKPQLQKNENEVSKDISKVPIYKRLNDEANIIKLEKETYEKLKLERETIDCTFKPSVKSRVSVTYNDNNPIHERLNQEAEKLREKLKQKQKKKEEEEIQAMQGTKSFVNRKSLLILNNKRPSTISTSSSSTTTEELLYGDIYNEQMKVSDVEPQEF